MLPAVTECHCRTMFPVGALWVELNDSRKKRTGVMLGATVGQSNRIWDCPAKFGMVDMYARIIKNNMLLEVLVVSASNTKL